MTEVTLPKKLLQAFSGEGACPGLDPPPSPCIGASTTLSDLILSTNLNLPVVYFLLFRTDLKATLRSSRLSTSSLHTSFLSVLGFFPLPVFRQAILPLILPLILPSHFQEYAKSLGVQIQQVTEKDETRGEERERERETRWAPRPVLAPQGKRGATQH